MNKKKIFAILVIFAIIPLALCAEIWVSTNNLNVNCFELSSSKLEHEIKMVVLSDLHEHEFEEGNTALIKIVKEQQPELILMLGDFVNEDSKNANVACELIEKLQTIAPVYFALGNHEIAYMETGKTDLLQRIETAGANILEEEYVDIDLNGATIRLGGLYDYAFGLDKEELSEERMAIKEYLTDFEETDNLKIMMSHRPDSFIFGDASTLWDIDLVVSGHNHGGQVVIPLLGGLFGGDQGYFPKYVHGMYKKDQMNIFVTSGLSSNPKPLPRFNNRPEIAVITIMSENEL